MLELTTWAAQAGGISVTHAADVEICSNVVVHEAEHDSGFAAIYVDALHGRLTVSGNTFVGFDEGAMQLEIATGAD